MSLLALAPAIAKHGPLLDRLAARLPALLDRLDYGVPCAVCLADGAGQDAQHPAQRAVTLANGSAVCASHVTRRPQENPK